jgi:hypothetical protein
MIVNCSHTELVDVDLLTPNPRNPNQHPKKQIELLAKIMKHQGWRSPIVVSNRSGFIVKGHGRLQAARLNGWTQAPVDRQDYANEADEYADMVADNKIAELSDTDLSMVLSDVVNLGPDFDLDLLGIPDFKLPEEFENDPSGINLASKFGAPPFSVLDTRQDYWTKRRRSWLALGLDSAKGRADNLMDSREVKEGSQTGFSHIAPTTSVFDPVLCELIYKWFSPDGSTVLDPFAGGSVRGVVASKLGRQYVGVDLRTEQVDENRSQALGICGDPHPVWHTGDSRLIDSICGDLKADLVFSCPPYADLEVYSDDSRDLSNMTYQDFRTAYREIIARTCSMLRDNRFACFVVGEVRDKKSGAYINFVSDTISAFLDAGLTFYNEAILVNQFGTAAMRANKTFTASRKLVKTHQNVLIFCKGSPKAATENCGEVDLIELNEGGVIE